MIFVNEKSRDLCKWCILLCHGLISLSLNYLPPNDLKKYLHRIEHYNISSGSDDGSVEEATDFDEKKAFKNEEKKISSNNDEKKALIVPSEKLLEKTSTTLNTPPPISLIGQVLLKRCEKQSLDLKNKYRPAISSLLNPNGKSSPSNNKNNTGDDVAKSYPSKRYSTLANSKPKRTQTMKFISSSAIYRFFNQKSNILEKASTDPDEYHHYTSSRRSSKNKNHHDDVSIAGNKAINVGDDKNIRLDCERPTFRQQPRTSHKNITPAVTLQVSRKCLKIMVRIRRHRNTI